jgi:hypothetical protein
MNKQIYPSAGETDILSVASLISVLVSGLLYVLHANSREASRSCDSSHTRKKRKKNLVPFAYYEQMDGNERSTAEHED